MNIIQLNELTKFQNFLMTNIKEDDFKFKYLINCLDLIFKYRQLGINRNSMIIVDNDKWLIFIETENNLFLYSKDHNAKILGEILKHLDLNKHCGKEIMGDYNLVYEILNKNSKDYTTIKDRLFYQTNEIIKRDTSNCEFGRPEDLEEIIPLFQEYYKEEYNGERNKSKDYLRPTILEHLENEEIYIIKKDNKIVAFCSIIDPDIGIMFTVQEYRKRGYSKQLISIATEKLLNQNQIANVMTDMNNIPSNKVCVDVGYNQIYEHTNVRI
jgi:hypothetical protein